MNYDSLYVPTYERPGYDRKLLESLSNRRENVSLIAVVVGDRTSKISRNKVDGQVTNCQRSVCDCLKWSYHQSRLVARSVVRPVTSWLYDQSMMSIYNRSPRLVVHVSVRLLTIGEDERYDQSWVIVRLVVAINDQSYRDHLRPLTRPIVNIPNQFIVIYK